MNQHRTVQQGTEAAQVLENPAFKDALADLRRVVTEQWRGCSVHDSQEQLLLLQLAKVTDVFESLLTGRIEQGKFAQHKIDLDKIKNESAAKRVLRRFSF